MVIILLLGECQQIISKNIAEKAKDQEFIEQAKATAIKYLKNKYELDVEITKAKMHPSYVADDVIFEGNITGSEDQFFTISVNYITNEISYFSMSPELVKAIRANGYDPFIKKQQIVSNRCCLSQFSRDHAVGLLSTNVFETRSV